MKDLRFWLAAMMAVVFILGLTACGSSEGSDDPDKPEIPKPETPIADGDWLTIPAAGGTIEKGDITLTFPSGTFSKETKVAVTEVRKGQTVGNDYEASSFYQITMPITTHKPMTISIKSAKLDDDVQFIFRSKGYALSAQETKYGNSFLEATFSNGTYTVKLPEFENGDESTNDDFTIGLAHIPTMENTRTRGDGTLAKGEVNGIKWELYADPSAVKVSGSYGVIHGIGVVDKIKSRINNAITEISKLGFELKYKNRAIRYYFISDPGKWGAFNQNEWDDYFNSIGLGIENMINSPNDSTNQKCTIIHETFHYFQSGYDPQWAGTKAKSPADEIMLYEMGAVWVEQFMNNKQLNANWLQGYAFRNIFNTDVSNAPDKLGLTMEYERWRDPDLRKAYQEQGYTMGALLYYLTAETAYFDNKSVLELHQKFKSKWKKGWFYILLDEWVGEHGSGIFMRYTIDEYYQKLLVGSLVKDFCISNIIDGDGTYYTFRNTTKKIEGKTGILAPFGCAAKRIAIQDYKDISLEKKELVIKQLEEDVHTFVMTSDASSDFKKFSWIAKNNIVRVIQKGDSIVLNGSTLEKMRQKDGTLNQAFFVVTTRIKNSLNTQDLNNYRFSFELRDVDDKPSVSPGKLEFPAEGNTQMVVIKKGGYKYCGADIQEADKKWLSKNVLDDGSVYFTATANDTKEKRTTKVTCWVANTANPSDAEKKALPAVEIIQAAGQGNDPQEEESGYELVSGRVSMYYAVAWKWEKSFKPSDDDVTITPNGKGAKVVINQEGVDYTATWKSTISFEIDDLSLNESNKAKIGHFRFELQKTVTPYNYYSNHIDSGSELIRMVAPAPHASASTGYWSYGKDDMSYYQKTTIHYDVWHKDAYSPAQEHTDSNETDVVTDGSWITISLNIQKKKK